MRTVVLFMIATMLTFTSCSVSVGSVGTNTDTTVKVVKVERVGKKRDANFVVSVALIGALGVFSAVEIVNIIHSGY